jgi:hypothetical protein
MNERLNPISSSVIVLVCIVNTIAGHRHQDQCRRHRYSGTQHLSPVQEFPLIWYRTDSGIVIPVPDWSDAVQSDIPAFKSIEWRWRRIHPAPRLYIAGGGEWVIHPASLICLRRTEIHPSRPHCLGRKMDTLCTSTLMMVVDGYTLHVHTASGGKGYTLCVYTASSRDW